MGVWLRPDCVWVSEATAVNLHSRHQTGGQQRSRDNSGNTDTHGEEVGRIGNIRGSRLTKRCDDGTRDAVGHTDGKDTHGPGVLQAKLELVGLTLQVKNANTLLTSECNSGACREHVTRVGGAGG